jgi:hypothetical protein
MARMRWYIGPPAETAKKAAGPVKKMRRRISRRSHCEIRLDRSALRLAPGFAALRSAGRVKIGLLRLAQPCAGSTGSAARANRRAVRQVYAASQGANGSIKIEKKPAGCDELETACRNTVAQEMREMGLKSHVSKPSGRRPRKPIALPRLMQIQRGIAGPHSRRL